MKQFSLFAKWLVLLLMLAPAGVSAQSIPEILYYRFDRTDSIAINHASGATAQTDTAFLLGGMIQDSIGMCGHALVGSGASSTTDYVNTGWVPDLANKSWTISFWTNNIQPSATLFYIFGDVNTSSLRCFTNGVAGAGNWILRGGGLADILATGGAPAGPSMTTFTYDSATAQSKAYVNGVLVNTVAQTAPNLTGTGPFKVGAYGSNTGLPAGGLMDEFRFYNRALTDVEVLDLYDLTSSANIVLTACDSMISPSGLYHWTASGIYNDTIPNVAGCDSIITFDLTIANATYASINPTACNGYMTPSGTILTATGMYQDIISNVAGCDSIIDIDLTIVNVDTTVSFNGVTLTSNSASGTYQWVDCGNAYAPISGEINQSFTPTVNGIYAVVVTDACTDTSACYVIDNVGINDHQILSTEVFPNPSEGNFVVNASVLPDMITVTDLIGNEVFSVVPMALSTTVSLVENGAGVYYIHVSSGNVIQHIKVVVTQ